MKGGLGKINRPIIRDACVSPLLDSVEWLKEESSILYIKLHPGLKFKSQTPLYTLNTLKRVNVSIMQCILRTIYLYTVDSYTQCV